MQLFSLSFTVLDTLPHTVAQHLRWIMQKDLLGQDVFLIGPPGPLRRSIAMQYLVQYFKTLLEIMLLFTRLYKLALVPLYNIYFYLNITLSYSYFTTIYVYFNYYTTIIDYRQIVSLILYHKFLT